MDDLLTALGLPKTLVCAIQPPRMDTVYVAWSIFAIDRVADCYYDRAALTLVLMDLQTRGLIRALVIQPACEPHVLIECTLALTARGERMAARVMTDRDNNPPEMTV